MFIYDMTDTWNDGGTEFTAVKMDVTDTASASGSLILDLLVGGASQFSVAKTGTVTMGGEVFTATILGRLHGVSAFGATLIDDADASAARTTLGLATVASTGAYSDLSGTPSLAAVATSGAYSDLSGTPDLSGYAQLAGATFTGNITVDEVTETVHTLSGTSVALDPGNGSIQTHTLSGTTTYSDSFSNGQSILLMIDDGSANTVTWPTMTWTNNGGSAPTLATSGYTVISLWKAGGTLYGALVGDGS